MTSGVNWKLPRTNNSRVDAVMQDLLNRLRRFDAIVYDELDLKQRIESTSTVASLAVTFSVPTPNATYTP